MGIFYGDEFDILGLWAGFGVFFKFIMKFLLELYKKWKVNYFTYIVVTEELGMLIDDVWLNFRIPTHYSLITHTL
jgi:hypothetical protein